MKVTQEKLPASQIGLEIEIPSEQSQQVYEQVIQQFSRNANIPGFRKGKVPRQILLQRLGQVRLKATALEELINDSLQKAIAQEEIEAIGNFELRSEFESLLGQFEPGQPLTISAKVDVQPDVALSEYQGWQLQAEEVLYDPAQVDKVLEKYRTDKATLIPVEGRPAQLGDVAVIDFQGRFAIAAEGEETPQEIPGGQADDFQVELSENQFIPGFIQGIVGMNPGDTKEIAATFPEGYSTEDLAGREAVFTVTLKELKEKELPELDDDFAKEVSDFQTLAELRESLETRFKGEAERKTQANKEQALLAALVKVIEVEVPATMVNREVDYLLTQQAMQLSNYGVDIRQLFTDDTIPVMRERSRPEAIERLKESLALQQVAKQESLSLEEAEIKAEMARVKKQLPNPSEVDPARLRDVVESDLVKQKTLKWLAEHNTVELVPEGTLKPTEEPSGAGEATAEPAASEATVNVTAEAVTGE